MKTITKAHHKPTVLSLGLTILMGFYSASLSAHPDHRHGYQDDYDYDDRHYNHRSDSRHRRRQSYSDFGVTPLNRNTLRVYHADYGWTASFRYLCLNDQCYQAHCEDGYYFYDFPAHKGQHYTIKIKVQDEHTPGGQYISSKGVRF